VAARRRPERANVTRSPGAARAQIATGPPLATHTLYHSTGAAQMALFDEEGVDPRRVCIGQCDTFPSLEYATGVARWGGYRDHILLSQDVGHVHEPRSRGGRGYTSVIERFLPALRDAGVDEDTIGAITVEAPGAG
jgi:predicted metal-dependent phosphotriesterase family hydrolase